MKSVGTRAWIRSGAAIGLCVGLAACSSQPKEPGVNPAPASAPAAAAPAAAQSETSQPGQPKRYDLTGKVVSIDKASKSVMVDAQDIPGFMSAMTMAYPVKDEHLLDSLAPGAKVTAKVVSSGSEDRLEDIATVK